MRLLIATAQADLRLSLELFFSEQPGVDIAGTASEGHGLFALIQTSKPDVIIADWDLPGRSLADIISCASASALEPKFIILTSRQRDRQTALMAGAKAAVLKGDSPDQLIDNFRRISQDLN